MKKKTFFFLKKKFLSKIGKYTEFYLPKNYIQKNIKKKILYKDFNLLGDYLFCYSKNLQQNNIIRSLQFTRGLKYFLNGALGAQFEIEQFIKKCKKSENIQGYLNENFFELCKSKNYMISNGPFTDKIFRIIDLQKNKITALLGNIEAKINRKKLSIRPV